MATILIVEDHAMSRQMLKALFGYLGHRILEAADGSAGLALARFEHPDLVISDVAMPTMDGLEFVRLLRAEPGLEKTPVIFYTATYRVAEAQRISEGFGACRVIPKPSEPLVILQNVNDMLGLSPPEISASLSDRSESALPESDPLRKAGLQLATLMDLSFHLAGQRDPERLLGIFCRATREILRCGQTLLALPKAGRTRYYLGHGEKEPLYVCPVSAIPSDEILEQVMTERSTYRRCRLTEEGPSAGSPESVLIIPFATPDRVYGWFYLADKLDQAMFRSEDEEMAVALSSQAALAYENILTHGELERKVAELERTVKELSSKKDALKQTSGRLREMAVRIAEAEETDRARLAREIHDSIGRNLTSLNITLTALGNECGPVSVQGCRERLDDSIRLVGETMAHARNVMADLRPPVLDDYGLLAALHWYAEEFTGRTGIAVNVRGEEPSPRLPAATELGLFRIAQEALNNTAKHAKASNVLMVLKSEEERIQLSITDDGTGFAPSDRAAKGGRRGWGLTIMSERADALGGRLGIETRPGAGTKIIIEAPR